MALQFREGFFGPPADRPDDWPDHPDLRRAVDWFKGFIPLAEWKARREAAAQRLYAAATGEIKDPSGKGRFFEKKDTFGWYLFLADAFLDHIWNYDYIYGSRVVPVIQAIGRDLPLLQKVNGVQERARKLVGPEKSQPNGGLFELLVASAYCREGADVAFVEERRGQECTHDMDVVLDGQKWAVECKRMETGEYGERERARMRELWGPSTDCLTKAQRSTFCDVTFHITIEDVHRDYLTDKVRLWLSSSRPSLEWSDVVADGEIRTLDLRPLQRVLKTDYVLAASSRALELLTGRYVRNESYSTVLGYKPGDSPRLMDDCTFACVLAWRTTHPDSIDNKARDITKKLSEAMEQLPEGTPSLVHIGFEAVEGDVVEKLRYQKILLTARAFDPGTKDLRYVCCHYLVPESPPDQAWAYDETTQWCATRANAPPPLHSMFLVLPEAAHSRAGPHWRV